MIAQLSNLCANRFCPGAPPLTPAFVLSGRRELLRPAGPWILNRLDMSIALYLNEIFVLIFSPEFHPGRFFVASI